MTFQLAEVLFGLVKFMEGKELRSRILKTLEKSNGLTISDVSRILGIHYTTASKYLAVMEAEKIIRHRKIGMAKLFMLNDGLKASKFLAIALIFIFISSVPVYAIPNKIPINGRLTFINDSVVNSTVNFTFSIFNARSGGTIQWNETQENLSVPNGAFSALLGNNTAINLSFDTDLFLQITVNNEVISPRFELGSVPYAYTANQTNFTKSNARALGDFLPNVDNSYNLGSGLLRWLTGFFVNVNATGYVNASEIEIRGASANLTRWRSGSAPLAAINSTGGLELTGGLRVTVIPNCNTIDTDASGNFRCGTDETTGGTTNTGWATTANTVYNDTTGVSVLIGTQTTVAGRSLVISGGGINVTGQINATNYTSNTFKVASCDIKADSGGSLYCGTDATGAGGGGSFNESGINRTLSIRLTAANNSINFAIPNGFQIVTIEGRINGTSAAGIINITFNEDNQTNYALGRITGATLTTSINARSLALEAATSALNRTFQFVIYDARRTRGTTGGTFRIVQLQIASSTAPAHINGAWEWINLTQTTGITSINIRAGNGANFLPGAYLIVKGEMI